MKISNYYGYADSLPMKDERIAKYKKQLEERGFDDTELWSLDLTMFRFLRPRLKRLVEIHKEMFAENESSKALEKLSNMLDEWISKDCDALLDDEAYEILAKHCSSMWY